MLLAARCRAALLVLHVFLLCYYAQYISQFQRGSAMLLAARCRAALLVLHVFLLLCYYAQYISQLQRGSAMVLAARCHAALLVLHVFFLLCYYYAQYIFHNSNGAARGCWLYAVVLCCW